MYAKKTPSHMTSLRCTFSLNDLRKWKERPYSLSDYYIKMFADPHPSDRKYLNTLIAVNVNVFSMVEKTWFQATSIADN